MHEFLRICATVALGYTSQPSRVCPHPSYIIPQFSPVVLLIMYSNTYLIIILGIFCIWVALQLGGTPHTLQNFKNIFMNIFFYQYYSSVWLNFAYFFFQKKNHVFTSKMAAKVHFFSLLVIFVSDFLNYCRLPSKLTKLYTFLL